MDEAPKVTFNAFDRDAEIEFSHRNLPHWFQVGAAIFVTFRTADSLPPEGLLRMKRELEQWLTELAASVFDSKLPNYEQLLNTLSTADHRHAFIPPP